MIGTEEEAALMRQVGEGDAAAYRRLVDAHLDKIFQFCLRMLGDRARAEEITQETFLRLWNKAADYKPSARVSTWLHRIAKNLCIDQLRKRREVLSEYAGEGPDSAEGPGSQLDRHRRRAALADALQQLPERQKLAITLVHYQGLSSREAADVMGLAVSALESLLARARRQLKDRLAPKEEEGREQA